MRAELSELRRSLRHYEIPHTLVSAMVAVSFLAGVGAFLGRAFA